MSLPNVCSCLCNFAPVINAIEHVFNPICLAILFSIVFALRTNARCVLKVIKHLAFNFDGTCTVCFIGLAVLCFLADLRDTEGKTPIDLAKRRGNKEIADYITNYEYSAKGTIHI